MFNVLIADDHSLIRSAVKLLLQNQGYRVVAEAVNGIDTIQLARQFAPDLIVLDITMPGLDGLQVAARLSERESPPAVVLCAAEEEFPAETLEASGVRACARERWTGHAEF